MQNLKEKYGNVKGKKDSMYLYILYNCPQEKLKEHVKKQLSTIERVSDSYKRKLFSSRYYLLRDMADENPEDHVYNCVIFISDIIDSYNLTKQQQTLLREYEHQEISYCYNDHFDLEYLNDMINCNDPYHVYRIHNNKIDHVKMTKTKKVVSDSKESKQLEIQEFIDQTLPPNKRFIMFGVSSKLKGFSDDRAYQIITKGLRDEEVIDLIERIDQEDILIELEEDLSMIHDDKQMSKVVFKKNLQKKIEYGMIEKLYIDSAIHDKFIKNMKKINLDVSFKVIQIDTKIKSFVEDRERALAAYGGVVGIAYY